MKVVRKIRQKGTILILTLLVVTLMSAAALGAAASSYSIVASSDAYVDSQIARETAMAGVVDVSKRLLMRTTSTLPASYLFNFSDDDVSNDVKKAPYSRYYSFKTGDFIANRPFRVAVADIFDANFNNYVNVDHDKALIFNSFNNSTGRTSAGLPKVTNPNHPAGKNESDTEYWTIKMGGPKDEFFSDTKGDFLNYDLIYLPLPNSQPIVLEQSDSGGHVNVQGKLSSWVKSGGRLWVDNGAGGQIINPPTGGDWSKVTTVNSTNYIMPDSGNLTNIMKDDAWMLNGATGGSPSWENKTFDSSGQTITSSFYAQLLRHGGGLTKPGSKGGDNRTYLSYPITTYEGSNHISSADADKAINVTLKSAEIYAKSGQVKLVGIGDRIDIYLKTPMIPDDKTTNLVVSGIVRDFDTSKSVIKLQNSLECRDGINPVDHPASVCTTAQLDAFADHIESNLYLGVINQGGQVQNDDFFWARYKSLCSPLNNQLDQMNCLYGRMPAGFGTTLKAGDKNTGFFLSDIRGYSVGSVVRLVPTDSSKPDQPLWGVISGITDLPTDYCNCRLDSRANANNWGTTVQVAYLKGGPTPRFGQSISYDSANNRAYMTGGFDVTEVFPDGDWRLASAGNGSSNDYFSNTVGPWTQNDVWEIDMSGDSYKWNLIKPYSVQLASSEPYLTWPSDTPLPRGSTTTAYISSSNQLIMTFGDTNNLGSNGYLNDIWRLDNPNDKTTASWTKVGPTAYSGGTTEHFYQSVYQHNDSDSAAEKQCGTETITDSFNSGATCMSVGDLAVFYGEESGESGEESGNMNEVYWGKVLGVDASVLPNGIKSMGSIYRGPMPTTGGMAYYSVSDNALYVYDGRNYQNGHNLIWKLSNPTDPASESWSLVNPTEIKSKLSGSSFSLFNITANRSLKNNFDYAEVGFDTAGKYVTSLNFASGDSALSNIQAGDLIQIKPNEDTYSHHIAYGVVADIIDLTGGVKSVLLKWGTAFSPYALTGFSTGWNAGSDGTQMALYGGDRSGFDKLSDGDPEKLPARNDVWIANVSANGVEWRLANATANSQGKWPIGGGVKLPIYFDGTKVTVFGRSRGDNLTGVTSADEIDLSSIWQLDIPSSDNTSNNWSGPITPSGTNPDSRYASGAASVGANLLAVGGVTLNDAVTGIVLSTTTVEINGNDSKPGDPESVDGGYLLIEGMMTLTQEQKEAYLIRELTRFASANQIKVTGYYGGIARAFLVRFIPFNSVSPFQGKVLDYTEVPAGN